MFKLKDTNLWDAIDDGLDFSYPQVKTRWYNWFFYKLPYGNGKQMRCVRVNIATKNE